jgi:hypothetical protein
MGRHVEGVRVDEARDWARLEKGQWREYAAIRTA